ncbi:tax1-binding protein 1 homolog [Mizuhopecten yessoensis]|uniref:Tax1-binding protein 1-like n=1 Tax=Mizuhopecten yessoensis TaxID=6573 RepID=A0A210Q2R3_MIZYE|nr:tax1-binding protein 1 homolog [Mizuhopecten yessoensis]XP_021368857.1 tax1-binding protein 1 homolog [Mizuhopecten yessoensis]OWF43030.1 Tax1-binding protein 1-like [Mizuhopecten yessoensis]
MESEVKNEPMDSKSEEEAKQSRTEFAMVVFHNIPETYPADAHIQCAYTITSDLVPTSYDWVGLYKVGWMSIKDYHYYEWAVISKNYEIGKEADSAVLFPAHKMPDDDGEFYQFCYVTSSGQIRGASTPFQFKKPSADDYVEEEDNDTDMLIIRSKSVVLEERLKLMEEDKARLEQLQEDMGKETDGLVQKLSDLDRQLIEAQKECHHLEERVQAGETYISQLNQEAHDMNIVREELQTRLDTQNHDGEEMEGRISRLNEEIKELKAEIRKLQNEKDKFEGEMRVMTGQIELYKNHFAKSETSAKETNEKLESLTREVAESESVIIMLRNQVDGLQQEIQDKARHMEKHVTSSKDNQQRMDCLIERLKNTEDKLEAAEHTKKLMQEEMQCYEETKEKMSSDLEKSESACYILKQVQDRLTKELNHMASDVEATNSELESVRKEMAKVETENAALNDKLGKTCDVTGNSLSSLHCLQMAQKTLKERYSKIEQSHGELHTEIGKKAKEYKQNIKELVRENEDLKERLNMSSTEYKTLYIENKKLQKKLGKLVEKRKTKKMERSISESSVSSQTFVVDTPVMSPSSDDGKKGTELQSSSQLEKELETMGEELRIRQEKKLKYKTLYIEEKAKVESLRKHFHEEMHKKDEETNRLRIRIEEAASANETRVRSLEKFVSEKEKNIAQLEGKLRDTSILCDGPVSPTGEAAPRTCAVPDQGSRLPPSLAYPTGAMPVFYPLVYPHPSRQSYVTRVAPPQLLCKNHRPLERLRYPEPSPTLPQPKAVGSLSDPLKPLPAPLVPERLHTAKTAAVMPSHGELMNEFTTDNVIPSAPPAAGQLEEKFEDAIGEAMKICPVCSESFSADIDAQSFDDHVLGHVGNICPICQKLVENASDNEFQYHVNKHLEDQDQETI